MRQFIRNTGHLAQAASYLLGLIAIGAAGAVFLYSKDPLDLADWALNVLGITFISLLCSLVFLSLFCLIRMHREPFENPAYWQEMGVQAANGVTTLALTFTLLGISLGIGSLAGQELTPDTVQVVIREVTANFSLAFMTTVIGLPISALLRSILLIAGTDRHFAPQVLTPSTVKKDQDNEIFDV
ncbi:MAG: hypothetical protein JKX94_08605 [Sneathiella sp.]|nr:hypothetical protein [Sneathiella sp.]